MQHSLSSLFIRQLLYLSLSLSLSLSPSL
jgi:hypothetical protein